MVSCETQKMGGGPFAASAGGAEPLEGFGSSPLRRQRVFIAIVRRDRTVSAVRRYLLTSRVLKNTSSFSIVGKKLMRSVSSCLVSLQSFKF